MVPLIGMTCLIAVLASPFFIVRWINKRREEEMANFCRRLMEEPPTLEDEGEAEMPTELAFHASRSPAECPDLSVLCGLNPRLPLSGRGVNVIEGTYRGRRVVTCDVRLLFTAERCFCIHPLGADFPEMKVFRRIRLLRAGRDVDPFSLGMPDFCEAFRIECDFPAFVREFFHPEMMKLLLQRKPRGYLVLTLADGCLVQTNVERWGPRQFQDAMDFAVEFQRLIPKALLDRYSEARRR